MFRRFLLILGLLMMAAPSASAAKLAVVDFQRAVENTEEGRSAQSRMDTMLESRRNEMLRMQTELEKEMQDFQSRAMILSEQARADAEQELMAKQQRYQSTAMQYETELAQTYQMLLAELGQKMRSLAITIAKEKGVDVLMDAAAVVYTGDNVVDITDELIKKYDAIH